MGTGKLARFSSEAMRLSVRHARTVRSGECVEEAEEILGSSTCNGILQNTSTSLVFSDSICGAVKSKTYLQDSLSFGLLSRDTVDTDTHVATTYATRRQNLATECPN